MVAAAKVLVVMARVEAMAGATEDLDALVVTEHNLMTNIMICNTHTYIYIHIYVVTHIYEHNMYTLIHAYMSMHTYTQKPCTECNLIQHDMML